MTHINYLILPEPIYIRSKIRFMGCDLVNTEVVLVFGRVFGLAKMHLVYVDAAFLISVCVKYAVSGVRLSRAV